MPPFKVGQTVSWTDNPLWTGVVTYVFSNAVVVLWSHPFLGTKKEQVTHLLSDLSLIKVLSDPLIETPPEDGEWE